MRASADAAGGDLAGLQARFARALLRRGDAIPSDATPGVRFAVYRNNVFASLINLLRARYPVIERLVGEEFFRSAAGLFIEACPPRSPVLVEYGEGFPPFLESFEPARGLPYLGDVARLEWLRNTAYNAAECKTLTAASLSAAPPERAGELTFELHPSAGFIASPYPVVSIWETNTYDAEVLGVGGLPGEAALILRPEAEVTVLRLEPGEHAFAAALGAGATLAGAAIQAAAHDGFCLPPSLARLIAAGAFSGFSPAHQP